MTAIPEPFGALCPRCGTWRDPSPLACHCGYREGDARIEAYRSVGWGLLAWLLLGLAVFCLFSMPLGVFFAFPLVLVGLVAGHQAGRTGRLAIRSRGLARALGGVGLALGIAVVVAPVALVMSGIVGALFR